MRKASLNFMLPELKTLLTSNKTYIMQKNRSLTYELANHGRLIFPPVIFLIFLLIVITSSKPVISIVILLLIPLIGIATVQLSRKYEWYNYNYIWLLNGINIYLLIILSGNNSPSWLLAIPFITGNLMVISKKKLQLVILTIFFIGMFISHLYIGKSLQENLTIIGILLLVTILMERSYSFLNMQMIRIHEQKIRIEEKQEEILDSIKYAKNLQNAILPPLKSIKTVFPDSFVFYKPKDIVAGDFYWIETIDEKVYITVADCTGHGVPGAMVSIMCSDALTKSVKELKLSHPSEILDKTDGLLEDHFSKSEEVVQDGMDLALCSVDLSTNKLEYAGANNPLYLIRNSEIIEFKANKQPVGRFIHKFPFTNHIIDIKKGDCIYLLTDGFPDQFGGPMGKKFKYKPMKELLISISGKPMIEQGKIVKETFEAWRDDMEQVDDVCFMGIRIL